MRLPRSDANDEAVLESASKFPFPDTGILLRRVRMLENGMHENISVYRRKANGRRDDPSLIGTSLKFEPPPRACLGMPVWGYCSE